MARDMLAEKGIIAKRSILDEIINTKDAPTLPGIPAYLPHVWTLQGAQHMMYDLLMLWKIECKDNEQRMDNITEFFTFVVKELRRQENLVNREIIAMPHLIKAMKTVPVLKDVFSPMRKKDTVRSMGRFFVDSFAVSIVVKSNHTVSEYCEWFLDWTQEMLKIWQSPENRDKI